MRPCVDSRGVFIRCSLNSRVTGRKISLAYPSSGVHLSHFLFVQCKLVYWHCVHLGLSSVPGTGRILRSCGRFGSSAASNSSGNPARVSFANREPTRLSCVHHLTVSFLKTACHGGRLGTKRALPRRRHLQGRQEMGCGTKPYGPNCTAVRKHIGEALDSPYSTKYCTALQYPVRRVWRCIPAVSLVNVPR